MKSEWCFSGVEMTPPNIVVFAIKKQNTSLMETLDVVLNPDSTYFQHTPQNCKDDLHTRRTQEDRTLLSKYI